MQRESSRSENPKLDPSASNCLRVARPAFSIAGKHEIFERLESNRRRDVGALAIQLFRCIIRVNLMLESKD